MPDIWIDVDTAITVPVNIFPLIDDTDFKSRETGIVYDSAGMDLVWNFITSAGVQTQTAVTPTTGGVYDWSHKGDGMYNIEIPAAGGASINNDTEGSGWFTGICTGVLPWRGPIIGFRAAALNDALIDGGDMLDVNVSEISGDATAADNMEAMYDGTGIIGNNFPAFQSQLRDIAITGSAVAVQPSSCVVTRGTETGTYANAALADGVYHEVAAVNAGGTPWNIDFYYQYDIGIDGVPTECQILGRLVEGAAPYGGDSVDIYAWDWTAGGGAGGWDHVSPITGDFIGSSSSVDLAKVFTMLTRHVGTGVNDGLVRIRLSGTLLESGTKLYIDQAIVRYTIPSQVSSTRAAYLDNLSVGAVAQQSTLNTVKAKTDNLPVAVKKNVALAKFPFYMVLAADHVSPALGKVITAERCIDGAGFVACTNAPVEVAAGWYIIDLAAADLNGTVIAFKFTEATVDARCITIVTQA
jgi:hypothetical protein